MAYKVEWRDPDGFGDSSTHKSKQSALDWKKAVENGGGYDVVITRMGSTSKSKKKKPTKKKKKKRGVNKFKVGRSVTFMTKAGGSFMKTFKSQSSKVRAKLGWRKAGGKILMG